MKTRKRSANRGTQDRLKEKQGRVKRAECAPSSKTEATLPQPAEFDPTPYLRGFPDPAIVLDAQGTVRAVNPAALQMSGYAAEDLVGRPLSALGHIVTRSLEAAIGELARVLDGQSTQPVEVTIRSRTGQEYILEALGRPVFQHSRIAGVYALFRDITQRKTAEEALRRSEELYRTVLESIEEGYYEVDLEGNVLAANAALYRILGAPRGQRLLHNYREFTDEANQRKLRSLFLSVYKSRTPLRVTDWEIFRPDGERVMVEASVSPVPGPGGRPAGFRGIVRDITDRRQMEQALRKSEERYRDLVENLNDVVYALDERGRVTYISPSVQILSGFPADDYIGKPFLEFICADDRPCLDHKFLKSLDGFFEPSEFRARNAFEGERWARTNSRPILDENGKIVGLQGVLSDITERKRMEEALRRSEQKFRALIENAFDGMYQSRPDGTFLMANPALVRMLGYASEEDLFEANIAQDLFVDAAQRGQWLEILNREGEIRNVELRLKRKDGTLLFLLENSRVVRDPEGLLLYYEGSLTDITDLKTAQEKLLALEKAVSNMQLGVTITDPRRRIVYTNEAEARMHGYTVGELLGQDAKIFGPRESWSSEPWNNLEGLPSWRREGVNLRKDGSTIPVQLYTDIVKDAEGHPVGVVTLCEDITERKAGEEALRRAKDDLELRVEERTARLKEALDRLEQELQLRHRIAEELRKNEEKYRMLFEQTRDAIYITTRDGQIEEVNQTALELFGFTREEAKRNRVQSGYLSEEDRLRFQREIESRGFVRDYRTSYRRKDGTPIDCLETASLRYGSDGSILGYQGIIRDITQQLRTEKKLLQRQKALQAVYETAIAVGESLDAVCDRVAANLADILDVSHAFVHLQDPVFGRKVSGLSDHALFHEDCFRMDSPPFASVLGARRWGQASGDLGRLFPSNAFFGGHNIRSWIGIPILSGANEALGLISLMDNRERTFSTEDLHLAEVFARYVAHEMERSQMARERIQLQRVQLLNQVTAGVAHEVRNPLNAILAMTEALALDVGEDPEHGSLLTHIKLQVERLARLMRDLLELGKPIQKSKMFRMSLADLCAETLILWKATSPPTFKDVHLRQPEGSPDIVILADSARLQQILINLLDNAAQHSPEEGIITLEIAEPSDLHARIRIIDQGTGVAPGDLPKVFDPFFTTRKKGTGLGLSIVKHIVETHGGEVALWNNVPGPGCTVEVRLPRVKEELE